MKTIATIKEIDRQLVIELRDEDGTLIDMFPVDEIKEDKEVGAMKEFYMGRFKKQAHTHIILDEGTDKRFTACDAKWRKDYEITSYAGPIGFFKATQVVTCKKCLKKLKEG